MEGNKKGFNRDLWIKIGAEGNRFCAETIAGEMGKKL